MDAVTQGREDQGAEADGGQAEGRERKEVEEENYRLR